MFKSISNFNASLGFVLLFLLGAILQVLGVVSIVKSEVKAEIKKQLNLSSGACVKD